MSASQKLSWPSHYSDEVMPEGRASPQDWIFIGNGRPQMAPAFDDEAQSPWELAEGDEIEFDWAIDDLPPAHFSGADKTARADAAIFFRRIPRRNF